MSPPRERSRSSAGTVRFVGSVSISFRAQHSGGDSFGRIHDAGRTLSTLQCSGDESKTRIDTADRTPGCGDHRRWTRWSHCGSGSWAMLPVRTRSRCGTAEELRGSGHSQLSDSQWGFANPLSRDGSPRSGPAWGDPERRRSGERSTRRSGLRDSHARRGTDSVAPSLDRYRCARRATRPSAGCGTVRTVSASLSVL